MASTMFNQTPKDDDEQITTRDYERSGVKFIFRMTNPFGFWTIHFAHGGKTPASLSGVYTTVSEAERGVKVYLTKYAAEEAKKVAAEKAALDKLSIQPELKENSDGDSLTQQPDDNGPSRAESHSGS